MSSEYVTMYAEDYVKKNNKIIFIAKNYNLLCSYDLERREMEVLDSMPEEEICISRVGAKILAWKDELILSPMLADKIWRYNLNTKEWIGYPRKRIGDPSISQDMFQAVLYDDKCFFIGSNYPAIVCLDLITDQVTYNTEPYQRLEKKKKEMKDSFFRCDYVQNGSAIYLASCLDNYVLRFQMSDGSYEWIKVGEEGNRYSGITKIGDDFWLAPRCNTNLVRWDGKSLVTEYELPEGFADHTLNFHGCVYDGKQLILPALLNPYSLYVTLDPEVCMEKREESYSFLKKLDTDRVIGQYASGTFFVSEPDGERTEYEFTLDKRKIAALAKQDPQRFFSTNRTIYESNYFDLDSFVLAISNQNQRTVTEEAQKGIGKEIWEKYRN